MTASKRSPKSKVEQAGIAYTGKLDPDQLQERLKVGRRARTFTDRKAEASRRGARGNAWRHDH